MKKHFDGNADQELTDTQLVDREEQNKRELMRLEQLEPGRRESTSALVPASATLLHAWERWKASNSAARLRGLLGKRSDLR
jgi:hypothetical protein